MFYLRQDVNEDQFFLLYHPKKETEPITGRSFPHMREVLDIYPNDHLNQVITEALRQTGRKYAHFLKADHSKQIVILMQYNGKIQGFEKIVKHYGLRYIDLGLTIFDLKKKDDYSLEKMTAFAYMQQGLNLVKKSDTDLSDINIDADKNIRRAERILKKGQADTSYQYLTSERKEIIPEQIQRQA